MDNTETMIIRQTIESELQKWEDKLLKEDFKRLERLRDLFTELHSIEFKQTFIYGVRLGGLLMVDVFTGADG